MVPRMTNMKKLRRTLLWVTVIGAANLAQVCALSAFIGEDKAWELFNSFPLMLMWLGLTGLLVAGLVLFPRLAKRPGLLTMHLACVLMLIGGMLSSKAGMKFMDYSKDHKRIYKGHMRLADGQRSSNVTDKKGEQFDELPFEVESERFRMEYYAYPHKKGVIELTVVVDKKAVKTGRWHGGTEKTVSESETERFKCELKDGKEGEWKSLPLLCDDVEIRLKSLVVQPPVTKPFLLVSIPDGHNHAPIEVAPVEKGHTFNVNAHQGQMTCTISDVYKSVWAPHPMDPRRRYLKRDDKGTIPAAEINITEVSGRPIHAYTKAMATDLGESGMYERLRFVPQADAEAETGTKSDGPLIIAFPPGMEKQVVPAVVGSEFIFMAGRGRTVYGRVKSITMVKAVDDPTPAPPGSAIDAPKRRKLVESKDPDALPMAEVDLLTAQGNVTAHTPAVAAQMQTMETPKLAITYIAPDDPVKQKGLQRPKMTFEVKRGVTREAITIAIRKGRPSQAVALDFLYADAKTWQDKGSPRIYVRDEPHHKEYTSDLVIRRNGKEVARGKTEVNHPFSYGGYHFYQSSYDAMGLSYTDLTVKSDAGWAVALAGMILLMVGTFLHFWIEPIWTAVKKAGPSDSDQAGNASEGPTPPPIAIETEQEAGE